MAMNAQEIIGKIRGSNAEIEACGDRLRITLPGFPIPEVDRLLPEVRRRKQEIVALLRMTLGGHPVTRIIWRTDYAIIFQDGEGRFWRYLYAYDQAWPVIIESSGNESA